MHLMPSAIITFPFIIYKVVRLTVSHFDKGGHLPFLDIAIVVSDFKEWAVLCIPDQGWAVSVWIN